MLLFLVKINFFTIFKINIKLAIIIYNMNNKFVALKDRRKSREIMAGDIGIGGNNPIRVQTMVDTNILDVDLTVRQIIECQKAGAELIRLATQTPKHARMLKIIKEQLKKNNLKIPLIADVHFLPSAAFEALKHADKIRLNPGNFLNTKSFFGLKYDKLNYLKEIKIIEESLSDFIKAIKKTNVSLRIGANHGSLSERIMARYGNTSRGMVESAMEYLRIFKKHKYNNLVVALKSSDPLIMIEANRMLVDVMAKEDMDYPVHLGVTEAGNAEEGRAKSTIGIGTLLLEGIGDTIRVSLTEHPAKEIPVCYSILQATRRRITKTEFISCPTCDRTLFDLEGVANKIKTNMSHLKGLRIAIMGCVVNGLGEMADADFGYIGGKPGMLNLYYRNNLIKRDIPEILAVPMLELAIKGHGRWIEPE
jgi:(E)-4-hydroxy-3-methylbut-2-enyl-diphosphate synthase